MTPAVPGEIRPLPPGSHLVLRWGDGQLSRLAVTAVRYGEDGRAEVLTEPGRWVPVSRATAVRVEEAAGGDGQA